MSTSIENVCDVEELDDSQRLDKIIHGYPLMPMSEKLQCMAKENK